jgi:hypothetical protein
VGDQRQRRSEEIKLHVQDAYDKIKDLITVE